MANALVKRLAAGVALCAATLCSAWSQTPRIKPDGAVWAAGDGFAFTRKAKTFRRSLSGVACPALASGQRNCLAVFDEGVQAHFFTIGSSSIHPQGTGVRILDNDVELDAEGAATDGVYFYVTGSHSAKRNSCESNPGSRFVIRFRVDPQTGLAQRDKSGRLVDYQASDKLWTIMAKTPALQAHVGEEMCLGSEPVPRKPGRVGKRGVNIEGIAIAGGRLHFGFRGPNKDGNASILSVNADALFTGAPPRVTVTAFAVGAGRSVRDLLAVRDGILVLAGPDDDRSNENVGWTIGRLDGLDGGDVAFRELAALDLSDVSLQSCDTEIKPEAMLALSDVAGETDRLLVLSDGMCDGGPLAFTAPR